MSNPSIPPIPAPARDLGSLAYCVLALKQGMDSLAGRVVAGDQAITINTLSSADVENETNWPNAYKSASFGITVGTLVYYCDTTSAAITVTLPASPTAGDVYFIKDAVGQAAVHHITVTPSGGLKIEGATSLVIGSAYGLARVSYSGKQWVQL